MSGLMLEFADPDVRSTEGNAWIIPRSYTADEKGHPRLTPHCATIGELEWQIDYLHDELEEIRTAARRKFEAARAKPCKPPLP
jgi:hypothetical protein